MSELTPLELISDRFAGDPQAGLKEIVKYLRVGTTATTYPPIEPVGVWVTEIRIPGTAKYTVEYREPSPILVGPAEYDSVKREVIKVWLHELTNVVRMYLAQPVIDLGYRTRDTTIREALQTAVAKPMIRNDTTRSALSPVDAFVSRVLARRGTGTPTV